MKMKRLVVLPLVVALVTGWAGLASAASSTQQTVTFEVQAINEISVSGNPGTLTVSTATAGQQPDAVSDNSTTYAITTNESNKKITVAIDTAMPSAVTLQIQLAAPSGATSAGNVTLSTTAADAVTGITQVAQSGLTITYTLTATVAAGVVGQTTRTVTLTIVAGA